MRKAVLSFASAVLCLAVFAMPAAAQTITNGNFEGGSSGGVGTGWTSYLQSGATGVFSIQTANPPEGTHYQQAQVTTASKWGGVRQTVSGCTVGYVYTIAGYYRTNSASATASIRVATAGGTTRPATANVSTTSTAFSQFSFNVTATGTSMTIFLDTLVSTASKAGAFDMISITPQCTPPTPPTSASANPSTVCSGSASTLTATGGSGTNCRWYTGSCGGSLVATGTSVVVYPASTTTYYVRWESACGNSTCVNTTVTANALPSAPTSPAANPTSITSGQSSTLSASVAGGCTVDWYSGACNGTFVGSGTSLVVSPTSTTSYYARARNTTTGCLSSSCAGPVTVTVTGGGGYVTITNGTFEGGSSGGVGTGWTSYLQSGAAGTFTIQTAGAPEGTHYQQAQITTASKWGGVRQTVTGCSIGTVYTIGGFFRTNSTSATASIRVDPAGGTTRPATANASTTSTAFSTFSFDVTATGTSMTIFLDAYVTTASKACAFDNITITGGSDPEGPRSFDVLVINFDPIVESHGSQRMHQVLGWNDPHAIADQYAYDLNLSSNGWATYNVVDWIDADWIPILVTDQQYDEDDYIYRIQHGGPWWVDGDGHPYLANYYLLIDDYNLDSRIASGEIDEVWFFGGPYFGFNESRMAGPGAYGVNGVPMPDVDSERLFIIMGFSYERWFGEALEDFCHRAEAIMSHVYGSWHWYSYPPQHNWDKFTQIQMYQPGHSACGYVHMAPNSTKEYEWENTTQVWSTCDDWLYNWPNLQGDSTMRLVNNSEWGGGNMELHHIWWLNHFPRAVGVNPDTKQNNWWKYLCDFNCYPESNH